MARKTNSGISAWSDKKLLTWGIVWLFLFFPVGIPLLVIYGVRKVGRNTPRFSPEALPLPHPLRGWTNMGLYEVHGINPKTNRSNKRTCECFSESDAKAWATSSGLVEPFTIMELPSDRATENQIAYLQKLDAWVDFESLTKVDASALIDFIKDGDRRHINQQELDMATEKGYKISSLAGPTTFRYVMQYGYRPYDS